MSAYNTGLKASGRFGKHVLRSLIQTGHEACCCWRGNLVQYVSQLAVVGDVDNSRIDGGSVPEVK